MAAIDVGVTAVAEGNNDGSVYTIASLVNPSNGTGTIDHIDIWTKDNALTHDFAAFNDAGSKVYSTNGVAQGVGPSSSGDNDFDAPGDFTAFDINGGELIGEYHPSGAIRRIFPGTDGGCDYKTLDQIPCTSQTFIYYNADYQLGGTGVTGEEEAAYIPKIIFIT